MVAPSLEYEGGAGVGPIEVRGRRRPYYYVYYPSSRFHAREAFILMTKFLVNLMIIPWILVLEL